MKKKVSKFKESKESSERNESYKKADKDTKAKAGRKRGGYPKMEMTKQKAKGC